MSEELLVNVTPMETRVAVVENGVVQELFVERTAKRGLVGSIYKGKIARVLPGMQAAFVEIGLERAAFLHAKDIWHASKDDNGASDSVPNISDLVAEGQPIVVQVTKDMIGTKGARLTTHLSIPSRFLVYMPYTEHIGISQRIEDDQERDRLREIMTSIVGERDDIPNKGFILRTAAEGADEESLRRDVDFLCRLWKSINEKMIHSNPVSLIHRDLALAVRTLRDEVRPGVEKVRIDSRETFGKVLEFVREYIPETERLVEH